MRVLKIFAVLAIISYALLIVAFYFTQRSLLYFPTRVYLTPAEAHADSAFREIEVKTSDGLKLKAWYAAAKSLPFTIVFFHGNGDSLSGSAQVAEPYIEAGYGFLAVEYRGFSGLPGKPTETGLYNDARACIHALIASGIEPRHMILYGHSLGTGVAIEMAREFPVGGLMVLAPYLSIPSLAQVHYPFLPARLLVLDRFENEKKIGELHVPVLVANGDNDELIPPSHGQKLFSMANEPKEYHSIPGRGHNDSFDGFAPISLDWIGRVCRA
ncbi:MAG: alpha/beta hydrolase [Acidobacteria bacterium]|nr:alpha/beta hydrolase [Acidobacteriota bacterium]